MPTGFSHELGTVLNPNWQLKHSYSVFIWNLNIPKTKGINAEEHPDMNPPTLSLCITASLICISWVLLHFFLTLCSYLNSFEDTEDWKVTNVLRKIQTIYCVIVCHRGLS